MNPSFFNCPCLDCAILTLKRVYTWCFIYNLWRVFPGSKHFLALLVFLCWCAVKHLTNKRHHEVTIRCEKSIAFRPEILIFSGLTSSRVLSDLASYLPFEWCWFAKMLCCWHLTVITLLMLSKSTTLNAVIIHSFPTVYVHATGIAWERTISQELWTPSTAAWCQFVNTLVSLVYLRATKCSIKRAELWLVELMLVLLILVITLTELFVCLSFVCVSVSVF